MKETEPSARATLWTTAYILMELRYPCEICQWALEEIRSMKASVTYQAILEEGREEGREEGEHLGRSREACRILLRQGTRRFGAPTAKVEEALEAKSQEQLEELTLRLLAVESWQELLAE